MHYFGKKIAALLMMIWMLGISFMANAIEDPTVTQPIKGSQGQFVENAESYVKDIKYFSLSPANRSNISNNSIRNVVGLGIEEESSYYIQSSFTARVKLEITTYNQDEVAVNSYIQTFTVNYDTTQGAIYKSFDYASFTDAYAVKVRIVGIDIGSASWPVDKVLKIENRLTATRDYPFDCHLALSDLSTNLSAADNELTASWAQPVLDDNPGITEYDLEWAWVDEAALSRYQQNGNYIQDLVFKNNATRVSIPESYYRIPLLYDDAGRLFVRVRAVQLTTDGRRIEGKWNWIANDAGQPESSANPVYFAFAGHEGQLNWQASTSFAEEGKRKTVVQYADGSLYNRQSVTKDNTSNTTVVAETFYDYQGRPVIQVLPAPTLNTAIGYAKQFNQAIGYNEYPKSVYDKLDPGASVCSNPARPFNTDFGTANYYSAKNPLVNTGIHQQIPDATAGNAAEGYAFSETRFTPDGRIASQGGVGSTHQLGSRHETKYFYEVPAQQELDALFGTDAGVASHYSKNIVQDANGQFSVAYVDMQGRTIATALAGEEPKDSDGGSMLDALKSMNVQPITRQLLDNTTNIVVGNSIVSSTPLVVMKDNTTYTFDYNLNAQQLSLLSCTNQTICYDCMYRLKFTITSDCDGKLLYEDVSANFTLGQYINQCNNGLANQGFQKQFSRVLHTGSYTVTKTLILSSEAQAAYRDTFLRYDTCRTFEQFYNQQLQALLSSSNCAVTCQTCMTAIGGNLNGFIAKFAAEMNVPVSSLSPQTIAQLTAAFNEASANCDQLCSNADGMNLVRSIREVMLQDVTPPTGQYALTDAASMSRSFNIFKTPDASNSLAGYGVITTKPDYLQPRQFNNTDQTLLSSNYVDALNQPASLPATTSVQDYLGLFQPAWANQLLVHHPEFKKLQLSEHQLKTTYQFEANLESIDTWAAAVASGYINSNYLLYHDPFFAPGGVGEAYRNKMEVGNHIGPNQPYPGVDLNTDPVIHGLNRYVQLHTAAPCPNAPQYANAYATMWQIALGTVFCRDKADGNACSLDYSNLNTKAGCTMNPNYAQPQNNFNEGCSTDRDWAWKTFKGMYLAERRKLISAYLNANAPSFSSNYPNNGTPPYQLRFINHANPQGAFTNLNIANSGNIGAIINAIGNNPSTGLAQAQQLAQAQYDTVCRGYAAAWIGELRACPQVDAVFNNTATWQADSTWLISRLVAICKNGSDENHFLGSSSVKPNNPVVIAGVTYTEFPQVIQEFLQMKGIANPTAECYNWLITAPKPYNSQTPTVTSYVVTKPTPCECQRLGELRTNWMNSGFAGNFSAYLQQQYGAIVSNDQLDALTALCNGTYACKMLSEPIPLPSVLQCVGGTVQPPKSCITCPEFQIIKTAFTTLTGQAAPFVSPQNQTEINWNEAFTAFANQQTGFNKTSAEYISFQITCSGIIYPPINCDNLNSALNAFYASSAYQANPVGEACVQAFLQFFNNYFQVVYSFEHWMGLFGECGTVPNVCSSEPQLNCTSLNLLIDGFYTQYGVQVFKNGNCSDLFVSYVNAETGGNYTYDELDQLYHECGSACKLDICEFPNAYLLKKAVNTFYLVHPQPWNLPDCTKEFSNFFNNYFGLPYNNIPVYGWDQIAGLYKAYGNCVPDIGTVCELPHYDCGQLQEILNAFMNEHMPIDDPGECRAMFTTYFNKQMGTHYTYQQLVAIYLEICHTNLALCAPVMNCESMIAFAQHFTAGGLSGEECQHHFVNMFNEHFATDHTSEELYQLYAECGYELNVCQGNYDCKLLEAVLNNFISAYMPIDDVKECRAKFTGLFNEQTGAQYTYEQIAAIYWENCGMQLPVCVPEMNCENLISFADTHLAAVQGRGDCYAYFVYLFNLYFSSEYKWPDVYNIYKECGYELDAVCMPAARHSNGTPVTAGRRNNTMADGLLPMLCNTPTSGPVTTTETPCSNLPQLAFHFAQEQYELYIDSVRNVFDTAYRNKCMAARDLESFTVTYSQSEYHYTLYYYDQAGNLVRTIPPEGVNKLGNTDIALVAKKRQNVINGQPEASNRLIPKHTLPTDYRYNTLGQVVAQKTPDGGLSHFYYDRLGRLVVSQNAEQHNYNKYSYTLYDVLGRIKEVGQLEHDVPMTQAISQDGGDAATSGSLANWLDGRYAEQVTKTFYDQSYADGQDILCPQYLCQANLRNRVSYTAVYPQSFVDQPEPDRHQTATYYSYDIHGNVYELLQDYNNGLLEEVGNRFKKLTYTYDLISGKVNTVNYQPDQPDAFYHKYNYDAENRLIAVYTSSDKVVWEKDARYEYYKHGPLARTILGHQQVQGMDYAYTLQGWLKGINGTTVGDGTYDMGHDGSPGSINSLVARDVYGIGLNYFRNDYQPINGATANPWASTGNAFGLRNTESRKVANELFNGNIAGMLVNIPRIGEAQLYGYRYDQLHRIRSQDVFTGLKSDNTFLPQAKKQYAERVAYDANGNITSYTRSGDAARLAMDKLTYKYLPNTNKLDKVLDGAADAAAGDYDKYRDIKQGQQDGNYQYDAIGNLVRDVSEGIDQIKWNVYGKIESISKNDGTTISYTYDATGNRISKNVNGDETWYIRDASGNVMSIYKGKSGSNHLLQTELHLYGSSRLGVLNVEKDMFTIPVVTSFERGRKSFELNNHLGNVLATITDKKLQVSSNNETIDYYIADIATANDYYPFGMQMPGRSFSAGNQYRYGFTGHERDDEISGVGNNYTTEYRLYDARIARWASVDPLADEGPEMSPYVYVCNDPINLIDPDGLWPDLPSWNDIKRKYNNVKARAYHKYNETKNTVITKYQNIRAKVESISPDWGKLKKAVGIKGGIGYGVGIKAKAKKIGKFKVGLDAVAVEASSTGEAAASIGKFELTVKPAKEIKKVTGKFKIEAEGKLVEMAFDDVFNEKERRFKSLKVINGSADVWLTKKASAGGEYTLAEVKTTAWGMPYAEYNKISGASKFGDTKLKTDFEEEADVAFGFKAIIKLEIAVKFKELVEFGKSCLPKESATKPVPATSR